MVKAFWVLRVCFPRKNSKFRYSNAGSYSLILSDVECSRSHRHQLLHHKRRSPVALECEELRLRTSSDEDRVRTLYFQRDAPSPLEKPTLNHCRRVLCLFNTLTLIRLRSTVCFSLAKLPQKSGSTLHVARLVHTSHMPTARVERSAEPKIVYLDFVSRGILWLVRLSARS